MTEKMTEKFTAFMDNLKESCRKAERAVDTVQVMAVSKTYDLSHIRPVLDAGHRVFGENKVQECRDKWRQLKSEYDHIQLHLIGGLQRNKVKYLPHLVDAIHTVDSEKLVLEIKKHMQNTPDWHPDIYIQINTGAETQKNGVPVADTEKMVAFAKSHSLPVVGLMCIPPVCDYPAPHFALLRKLAHANGLEKLSMGMSADYDDAINLGSTIIRIGTAIFGTRTHGA